MPQAFPAPGTGRSPDLLGPIGRACYRHPPLTLLHHHDADRVRTRCALDAHHLMHNPRRQPVKRLASVTADESRNDTGEHRLATTRPRSEPETTSSRDLGDPKQPEERKPPC